ncbi:hypothetical protein QBC40DRAFT_43798 [Triangularia verruculosa]|uniref:Uncharacterized protein n=1 Tax=Triangularia verruculosa TaxID=2587418 RepID=A0AAN7AV72_9PEZI|nr:hypothetical protein QBC40DRAFT_43798 [Triangularia verruculosa]
MPPPVCHYEGSPRTPRPPPLPDFSVYSLFDPGALLAPPDTLLPSPLLVGTWGHTSAAGSAGSGGSPASGDFAWDTTDYLCPYPYQPQLSPLAGPGDFNVNATVATPQLPVPDLTLPVDYPGPYDREFFHPFLTNDALTSFVETCLSASNVPLRNRQTILATRCHAVSALHGKLATPGASTSDETLQSIANLIMNDLCNGETQEIPVHIDALREATRLGGGLATLASSQRLGLAKTVVLVDKITALAISASPLFSDQEVSHLQQPSSQQTPPELAFPDEEEIAAILKDITFLTSTVLALPTSPSKWEVEKVASMSAWVYNRLSATEQEPPLRKAVRWAALVYCRAVRERKPCHRIVTAEGLGEMTEAVWSVPLEVWAQSDRMLGVLIWILGAGITCEEMVFKSKVMLIAAAVEMGTRDWDGVMEVLKRVVKLQEWLRSG